MTNDPQRRIRKALLKVGYACNNRCLFCHSDVFRDMPAPPLSALISKIGQARRLGADMIVFSGGEPTIRSDLPQLLQATARLGMVFGLVTNGRRLGQRSLLEGLHRRGLRYVYLSLHGAQAATHDALVAAQAYSQVLSALHQLVTFEDIEVTVNCVVCRPNLAELEDLIHQLAAVGRIHIKFSVMEGKGAAVQAFDPLYVPLGEVAPRIYQALAAGELAAFSRPGLTLGHDGLPPCLAPSFDHYHDDLLRHGIEWMVEAFEDCWFPVDERNKRQAPVCAACARRETCAGIYHAYADRAEENSLQALPEAIGNSWNYEPVADLKDFAVARCPIRAQPQRIRQAMICLDGLCSDDRPLTLEGNRGLILLSPEGIGQAVFQTAASNFSTVQIRAVRDDLGQIYLERGQKAVLDDFAADLRLLRLAADCRSCSLHPPCPGGWQPQDCDQPFKEAESELLQLLESLQGHILDVGSGSIRYGDLWARLCAAGAVRYLAVEPDPQRVAEARQHWPQLSVHAGRIEDFSWNGPPFDHLLLLRSINHLAEPVAVLGRLHGLVRPGGQLIAADNVAFGLVRPTAATEPDVWQRPRFEHYRNDSSHAALAHFSSQHWTVVHHNPVAAGRANQWLLVLQRKQ